MVSGWSRDAGQTLWLQILSAQTQGPAAASRRPFSSFQRAPPACAVEMCDSRLCTSQLPTSHCGLEGSGTGACELGCLDFSQAVLPPLGGKLWVKCTLRVVRPKLCWFMKEEGKAVRRTWVDSPDPTAESGRQRQAFNQWYFDWI